MKVIDKNKITEDPYLHMIYREWNTISLAYKEFENNNPIVEYNIVEDKIYSYPGNDYIQLFPKEEKNEIEKEYQKTIDGNKFIVVINDKENEKLKSYIFEI